MTDIELRIEQIKSELVETQRKTIMLERVGSLFAVEYRPQDDSDYAEQEVDLASSSSNAGPDDEDAEFFGDQIRNKTLQTQEENHAILKLKVDKEVEGRNKMMPQLKSAEEMQQSKLNKNDNLKP